MKTLTSPELYDLMQKIKEKHSLLKITTNWAHQAEIEIKNTLHKYYEDEEFCYELAFGFMHMMGSRNEMIRNLENCIS